MLSIFLNFGDFFRQMFVIMRFDVCIGMVHQGDVNKCLKLQGDTDTEEE